MNIENIPKLWKNKFFQFKDFSNIMQTITNEYNNNNNKIYPSLNNIFNAFQHFDFNETKIVILGQDPYYSHDFANGIAFGINNSNNKIPPSLKNIKKELKNDLNIELDDLSLLKWCKQKILLLNTSLTVIHNKPTSHIKIWKEFIKYIINLLNNELENIIFIAWGRNAHQLLLDINTNKHKLLISSHPSPLSFNKSYNIYPPFNNSKPFSMINKTLKNYNFSEINW